MQLQASDRYGLLDKSDSAGFIAVFPNGYSRFPGGKLATWNAGTCCAQAREAGTDDVGFVRAILDRLPSWVSVNRQRVLSVPGATCETYAPCRGGTQVELCVTDTGGHSWPDGSKSRAGKGDASQAIRANDVMWEFFQRVSAPVAPP